LITLTTDFHLATLPGVEDVTITSVMVLGGVFKADVTEEMVDPK
jgi:hypothetical protein